MKKGVNGRKSIKNKIVIICEGDTEICYFKSLKSIYQSNLDSHIEPIGPCKKLSTNISGGRDRFYDFYSKEIIKNLSNSIKENIKKHELNKYVEQVYLVVDIDDHQSNNHYDRNTIDQMRKFFKKRGWIVLFSNRDIETFIHSHIRYSESTECRLSNIKSKKANYNKGDNINLQGVHKEIILSYGLEALKDNMKKLKQYHDRLGNIHIYDMNPYSEVVEIIEKIGL